MEDVMAVTSIDLEPALVAQAKAATGQPTTKGAVVAALQTVVRLADQRRAVDAIASLDSLSDLLDPDVVSSARR
jgi:Arc/MetJ family transcription regulator